MHRLVLFFPGFEPLPAAAHARRFARSLPYASKAYGVALRAAAPPEEAFHGLACRLHTLFEGAAPASASVLILDVGAVNRHYAARHSAARLLGGILAVGDFLFSGTFFSYCRVSWRYAAFFLYPVMLLLACLVVAAAVAFAAWAFHPALGAAGFALALAGILWLSVRRFHLLLLMDDWSYARDLARGRNPFLTQLLEDFVACSQTEIAARPADEIVIAAHSLGAVPALHVASALASSEQVPVRGILSVGSSLLKVALHPAAAWVRAEAREIYRLAVPWLDVQSLTDYLCFYRSSLPPVLGLAERHHFKTLRVRFSRQLSRASYRRIRRDFYRIHRQYVYGVERPTGYSLHMILCGPTPFAQVVEQGGLQAGDFGPAPIEKA